MFNPVNEGERRMKPVHQERQEKKDLFSAKKPPHTGKIIGLLGVVVAIAVAGFLLIGQGTNDGPATVKAENGYVRMPLKNIDDGQAHFFTFETDKGQIDFFVVKSVDGQIRAAFDACDVCYKERKGYRQSGEFMVCNNCGQQFRTDLINEVKGGCNPAPLARKTENNEVLISQADLLKGGGYFGI